ncbi:MAG: hypothetical protein UT66_C0017G0014 [candidate division CPR2 bacterium GW2011_GWC1_39_9]|uniref:Uncharacterized protein n=1 Tax=candidate division CPR2 bacterium GW2011_GWC2_39_10 TaxID=1618345 RepID=A0A0G0PYF1_UNCC2|nr:MAG: hypothetical protein UT18_C0010G0023 [candidate division CPR2 bacterium GW2011_GWC2_39_10]KKR34735.1 MAG: hypothetical protein UT66_C0017G0014 [candidate division CPR2 bacterium GW2011_GWC1_39_9]
MEDLKPKGSRTYLTTVSLVVISALAAGGSAWFFMNQKVNSKISENNNLKVRLDKLEKEKDSVVELIITPTPTSTSSNTQGDLTNEQELIINTLSRGNDGKFGSDDALFAARIGKIDGIWAVTNPIPLRWSQAEGYNVPGMGGGDYVWEKIDKKWNFIGICGEGGCNEAVKAKFSEIPLTVIPQSKRESI